MNLTLEAQESLDAYLTDVRSAVTGHASVSPDEIEQDVRDHVQAALEGAQEPITAAQIEDVLERLGPPTQWVAGERRSMWKYLTDSLKPVGHKAVVQIRALPGEAYQAGRGLAARVRGMSHDWRLAYLAFGLFALGLIAFPLFPAFLLASYIAARADAALARERGETLGARRWLIYPPMVIVSLVLFLNLALWPIFPSVAMSHEIPRSLRADVAKEIHVSPRIVEPVVAIYLSIGSISLWWCIMSLVLIRVPRLPGLLFPPFGSGFKRTDALIVFLLSATVLVLWTTTIESAWRAAMVLWVA